MIDRDRKPGAVVAVVPAALAGAAVGAPLLAYLGYWLAAFAIMQFFSAVCHQDPARSFWLGGAPVAVCARCLGIYLGAAAGAGLRIPRRELLAALAVVASVSLADYAAEVAGLHGNWPWARFTLGVMLGAGLGALVAGALEPPARHRGISHQRSRSSVQPQSRTLPR
ncbi:MAG: DUF2085 domain-containing protein [Terriglobales bacterium]